MVKVKLSNFELLKVVAMLMIVCHHLITQNAFNIDTQLTGLNASRMFCQFIGNHAFVGNNLFFMVSAWFLCTTTETFQFKKTVSRIWSLEKVMLFYSISIPVAIGLINDQLGSLLKIGVLFPLSLGLWWYPTAYAIFLVFYPFYQQSLQVLGQKEMRNLIIVMVVLWTLPTIVPVKLLLGANNTTCFFMLYAIIFYVRKFKPAWAFNKKKLIMGIIGGYAIAFASIIMLDFLGMRSSSINDFACYYIRGNWRILPVVISVTMFLWIAQLKMRYSRVINWMGGVTFSVYLIHMHPLMIDILFKKIFVIEPYIDSLKLVSYIIGVTFLIFFVCAMVDQIRKGLYWSFEHILKKQE